VIGSRFKGEIKKGAMPWHHRWLGNPILTKILGNFFDVDISDAHSGFRAFKRSIVDELDFKSTGMEFASEMIIKARKHAMNIVEVPITYYPRPGSASKLSSFSDGWRHLKFMFFAAPKYLFIYPGLFLAAAGVLSMVLTVLGLQINLIPRMNTMIVESFIIIVGYQILFFGFFAYVSKGKS
jgi:hypothetical protein